MADAKHWSVKIHSSPCPELQSYLGQQIARASELYDAGIEVTYFGTEHIYCMVPTLKREDAPAVILGVLRAAYGTTFNLNPNFG
jgi:hypothetical protein